MHEVQLDTKDGLLARCEGGFETFESWQPEANRSANIREWSDIGQVDHVAYDDFLVHSVSTSH